MIEYFFDKLDKFAEYIIVLLDTELMYLKPIDILLMAGFMAGTYVFVKVLVKAFFTYGAQGAVIMYKPAKGLYKKIGEQRKNKRICPVCKNPLHACTCFSNRGVSYRERKKKWKQRNKGIKKSNKAVKLTRKLDSRGKRGR